MKPARTLVTLCVATALASCGLPSANAPTIGSDVALDGGTWVLTEGTVNGRSIDVPDGRRITLTLGQGKQVGGSSACNSYGATVDVDGDRVNFELTAGTDVGCGPEVMAAERDYLEALSGVTDARRHDGTLQLSGPELGLTFEFSEPVAVEDITGIEWRLESLVVDGATTPAEGEPANLVLLGDGTVTGSTGCRQLHGRYDAVGDQIITTDFAAEGDCPLELQDQDGHVVGVLGDGSRAEVRGQDLRLTSDGNVGLRYRRSR